MPSQTFPLISLTYTYGGYFAPPKGALWTHSTFTFPQNKFYCFTKGGCSLTIEEKTYDVKEGDWFFIPAGVQHSYYNFPDKPFEKYWMHFDLPTEADILQKLSALPHLVKFTPESDVLRLFASYFELYESDSLADSMTKKSLLFALLAEYIRLACSEGTAPPRVSSDARIDVVLRYIHHHLREPLSVTALAERFYMHPHHFIRFFKNKTGHTPARYIKTEKMRLARELLLKTDMQVSEIMEKIGQSDPASFSKQFKDIYAFSPQEVRRQHKVQFPDWDRF